MINAKNTCFSFKTPDGLLFSIKPDGSIERGPMFTTNDEMSLKFWEAVRNNAPSPLVGVEK